MRFEKLLEPGAGYTSNDPSLFVPKNALIKGSKNMVFRGTNVLESFPGLGAASYDSIQPAGGDLSYLLGKGWSTIGSTRKDDGDSATAAGLDPGAGNIIEFVGRSLWFAGSGAIRAFQPGITTAASSGSRIQYIGQNSSIPQLAVVNDARNGYTTPIQVGVNIPPDTPVLFIPSSLGSGFIGKNNGSYSLVETYLRTITGGESLPTNPSNIIVAVNQSIVVQLSEVGSVLPRDRHRIYATPAGFGSTGPYLFFDDIPERRVSTETGNGFTYTNATKILIRNPVQTSYFTSEMEGKRVRLYDDAAGTNVVGEGHITGFSGAANYTANDVSYYNACTITWDTTDPGIDITSTSRKIVIDSYVGGDVNQQRAIEIEWTDSDLGTLQPPTDYFTPPGTCSFVIGIANVMVLVGVNGGVGLAVSVPNFPEAYPPSQVVNLPEPIVGVISRPQDGFAWLLCANSIHIISWTGAVQGPPLRLSTVADQVGCISQRTACVVGNALFTLSTTGRPVMITPDGQVDTQFGSLVEEEIMTWDLSNVCMCVDEAYQSVLYIHNDTILKYHPNLKVWSSPVKIGSLANTGKPLTSDGNRTEGIISAFTMYGVPHLSGYDTGRSFSASTFTLQLDGAITAYTDTIVVDTLNILTVVETLNGFPLVVKIEDEQILVQTVSDTVPGASVAALAGTGAGNVENGTHSYKITFVTAGGETNAGTVSNIVTVIDKTVNGKVALTSIPISTNANIVARKIYRTVAGNGGNYKLVGTILDNTTTVFTDNIADGSLGADVASTKSLLACVRGYNSTTPVSHLDNTVVYTKILSASLQFTSQDIGKYVKGASGIPTGSIITRLVGASFAYLNNFTTTVVTQSTRVEGFDMWWSGRSITYDSNYLPTGYTYYSAGSTWQINYAWNDFDSFDRLKTITRLIFGIHPQSSPNANTVTIYRNYEETSSVVQSKSFTLPSGTVNRVSKIVEINTGVCQLASVVLSGSGSREKVFYGIVRGILHNSDANIITP